MRCPIRNRLTYANVMATMGVFLALGGVGYAAATVDSSTIVNNSIRGKDVHQKTLKAGDVAKNALGGGAIKESKLGQVPSAAKAADAAALGGLSPDAFERSGSLVRYSFKLGAGETRELVSHGPLKLTARCIDNGPDQGGAANRDAARIYASTTQDGAILSANDMLDGGPLATDFLAAATAETDSVWSENSEPDGTIDGADAGDDDIAFVAAPDGAVITGMTNEAALLGVNVFGSACAYEGLLILS